MLQSKGKTILRKYGRMIDACGVISSRDSGATSCARRG
jgi:hypothetical protein